MNIIGIDASTKSTGIALFKNGKLTKRGLIRSKEKDVYTRIGEIQSGVKSFIKGLKVDYIFIENVPLSNRVNRLVAEHLLVLQGAILSIALENGIKMVPLQPTNWRRLAGVSGRRREEQKQCAIEMVESVYHFGYSWVDKKTDEKIGDSDVCEAILIGKAGIEYLNNL